MSVKGTAFPYIASCASVVKSILCVQGKDSNIRVNIVPTVNSDVSQYHECISGEDPADCGL